MGGGGAQQLTNEDLNELIGAEYWGKDYYADQGNGVMYAPTLNEEAFYLQIRHGGDDITFQFIAVAEEGDARCWYRFVSSTIGIEWKEIATVSPFGDERGASTRIFYSTDDLIGLNLGATRYVGINYNAFPSDPPKKGDYVKDQYGVFAVLKEDYDTMLDMAQVAIVATVSTGTYMHNITIDCGNNGIVTTQVLSTDSTAFATVDDFIDFLSEKGLKVNAKTPLSASGFYIQNAGSVDVTYQIVGVGQYGNRTDGVGIYYFRTDVSVGRSGYQIIMATNIDSFTDKVAEV